MATGTNWITIKPSQGGNYASTAYTLKIDSSFSHGIILADQAKGIASVQPSVVGQGKSEKILGFEAPLIKNDQVNPKSAEFLQVQREFSPSGVVFDPPDSLTFHYQD